MSSIDDKALRAGLRTLAAPLFDALTAHCAPGQAPFPLGPNPRLASYYTQRTRTTMGFDDFLVPSCLDAEGFGARLAAHWRAHGHPELAAHAPQVAEAARALHALYVAARPQAELSPYVYQMF
jgi:hypothetical protein